MYAHALIERPDGSRVERGDVVEKTQFSDEDYEHFLEIGAISEEEYDPAADAVGPPSAVVIDGVTYTKSEDLDA